MLVCKGRGPLDLHRQARAFRVMKPRRARMKFVNDPTTSFIRQERLPSSQERGGGVSELR